MHLSSLGFGTRAKGGGAVQRMERPGHMAPSCPSGARSVGSGSYGTGASTVSWRDCEMQAPRAAPPPPPPPAPVITVSPAIQTQVSPQISPVMTQMQASPGASVAAQPISAPGPMTAATAPQQDIERILEAERRAMAAESEMEAEKRAMEMRELQRQYAAEETRRAQEAMAWQAEQERQRQEDDAAAAAAAEAEAQAAEFAQQRAATSIVGAPTPIMAPSPVIDVSTGMETPPDEPVNLMPLAIAAAAALGIFLMTRGNNKPKRARKK